MRALSETASAFDVERVRADFPTLRQELSGRPLVYLDSAATALTPAPVIDTVARFETWDRSNVHRGVHELSQRATAAYEETRDKVRGFLNAPDRKELIFTRGTTEAINLVAQCFARPRLAAGDEVLITAMEHHSNIVPWQMVCEAAGATLKVAPMGGDGVLDLEAFAELLSERTKLVSAVHVSNALGTVNPVSELVELAHARGVPVMLDGAQAVPHVPVDLQALGCDFYAFSAHKLFGPTGVGVLWGRAELLREMPPYQGGGDMIRSVSFERTTYADIPMRFEAGTPNISGVVGLGAALDYLSSLDAAAAAAHETHLLESATAALSEICGLRLVGTAPEKAGVLSFVMDCAHPHDIGTILDSDGVAVRTGHHCAQPVMKRLGVPATARASFAFYNTDEDVSALARSIRRVREVFA